MFLHSSLLFLAVSVLPTVLGGTGPAVNTTSGFYVGVHDAQNEVDVFLGLRFAKAPLARFTPTTPISEAPEGPQTALAFGADCPQLPAPLTSAGIPGGPPLRGSNRSEDCFFRERTSTKVRLPILVSIFGGGYFLGSGSEWNGTSLVRRSVATKKPMIFINFNYRTGVFGFIGSAQAPSLALNAGLQDQRDALRWIQNNAEAFGGDGSRITITGESAGGSSVHMHLLYPDSQRTFRAGISSSGTSLGENTPACAWHDRPGGAYNILGSITGCGAGSGSFKCLQDIPFDTFLPLALTTYSPPGGGLPPWGPCKGPKGSLIDEYPAKKVIDGDFLNVPIVTGTNLNEGNFLVGTTFIDITPQPSIDEENSILSGFIGGQATNFRNVSQETLDKIIDLYAHPTDNLSNSSLSNRAAQFATDYLFLAPNRLFLEVASARKQEVWAYSFQQPLAGFPDFLGAFHTSDLYYLDIGFSPVPIGQLTSQLQDFYIAFTNDLTPGSDWPKYEENSKVAMRFLEGEVGVITDTVRRNQTNFFNQVDLMEEFGRFG
ncbi:Alpha/Beta hydrolase protein [Mycena alexandri]|uniref:Carboxylic ester hydrolase n=1 Tax=Mycena alexandri TaxID=1745969 RepID=A0AAD6WL57_9AGAR|nr:Alpha/Beta hydrolase protein [Mycena alexandri]